MKPESKRDALLYGGLIAAVVAVIAFSTTYIPRQTDTTNGPVKVPPVVADQTPPVTHTKPKGQPLAQRRAEQKARTDREAGRGTMRASPAYPMPHSGIAPRAYHAYRAPGRGGYAASVRPREGTRKGGLGDLRGAREPTDREKYQAINDNPVKRAAENPVSTFSVDVDTGAYANVRRFLNGGRLPPKDAVRIEELVNYFTYNYKGPDGRKTPFSVTTEVSRTPWNKGTYLLHIGVKGYDIKRQERPAANLVFLIDVSGSMNDPKKLPLLVASLKLLTEQLGEKDRVSIVVYAGAAGVVLQPTSGKDKAKIRAALESLSAGGSTAGGAGIRLAYAMAEKAMIKGGINRVILATDGDFNVGTTSNRALQDLVSRKRKSGITLTTLGFGAYNYNEHMMERIADLGNGNYAYIDTLNEGRKVLVQEMSSTLFTIAKDVKIQIEFNPSVVAEYRLIGYVNRKLKREDFANDKVDAGDIGAGHTVTALYEIALVGSKGMRLKPLRYGDKAKAPGKGAKAAEFAFLRIRYKAPKGTTSKLIETPLKRSMFDKASATPSENFRFSAAVAGFAQVLRGGKYTGTFGYDGVLKLAQGARGKDPFGYRAEFLQLVKLARSMGAS